MQAQVPALVVHGIWDTGARIDPLVRGLQQRGVARASSFDLQPNDGRATIAELALQVRAQADALLQRYACAQLDVVGFSMGALATRYYLQRCGGRACVRRFVSISGPHAGTWTAFALPHAGTRDMRPGSACLAELAADPDPFGSVEVHCIYTPLDLMIVPATSSVMPGVKSVHSVPVALHRWMISDPRVLDLAARALQR